jgi:hypothetical protein
MADLLSGLLAVPWNGCLIQGCLERACEQIRSKSSRAIQTDLPPYRHSQCSHTETRSRRLLTIAGEERCDRVLGLRRSARVNGVLTASDAGGSSR